MGIGDLNIAPVYKESRVQSISFMHPSTLIFIVVAFIITVAVALIFARFWGIFALIGLFFMVLATLIIVLNRGKHIDTTAVIMVGLALLFFALTAMGAELAVIDMGQLEMLNNWHQLMQGVVN